MRLGCFNLTGNPAPFASLLLLFHAVSLQHLWTDRAGWLDRRCRRRVLEAKTSETLVSSNERARPV